MAQYTVAIIIPVYNQWHLTEQCLRSLREHTSRNDVQVIVVDNGSTDATRHACPGLGKELFAQNFCYIALEKNIHFGPGCNLGASRADAEFLLFLNNDTLLTPDWLAPLLQAFMLRPNLGAVGPLLLYPESNRVQHLGVTFTPNNHVTHLYHYFPRAHPVVSQYRELQAITGAALLIPTMLFEQVGGFWPEYRNGYEDLDLCAQIRRQGETLICEPSSQIYHLTSQTQGRFDSNDHNAHMLQQRCSADFYPDMHVWAARDGYQLRLGRDLEADIVCIRPQEETAGFDLEHVLAEVLAEPLWEDGYIRLVQDLFQRALWSEALDVLQMQQCFFSSEDIVLNIAKVATKTQNKDLISKCQTSLRQIRQTSSGDLYQKFLSIRRWADAHDDQILRAVCQQWEEQFVKRGRLQNV